MSFCNRAFLPVVVVMPLAFLIGCGSSSNKVVAPPSGAFSNSSLKGTYVFTIIGSDSAGNFVSVAGTFAADGASNISGGTVDINDSGFAVSRNNPITAGSYVVTQDGRGQAALATATPWGAANIKVDFVLTSSGHGFTTQFDNNGTGSGSLDLQTAAGQPAAGNYVLGLSGVGGNTLTSATLAGAIAIDSSGNATGSFDYNNGSPFLYTLNAGSTVMASGTPGTATLVAANSGPTFQFDIYAIDSTHWKFIETDNFPNVSGDLFSQTSSALPSGQLVFTMAGFDLNTTTGGPLAVGGLMTSDGASTISNGEEDFNDAGVSDATPQAFTGVITPPASGSRFTLSLNNFVNGNGAVVGSYQFAAYPSSGGIELVEIDSLGVSAGVAFSQSSTSLASAQGYGLNLSGSNSGGFQENDIAEFTTTSTTFKGLIDINDGPPGTGPNFKQNFNGAYTLDSPATGRGVFTSNVINGAFYTVNGTEAIFIETDSTQVGLGAFQQQNPSAMSNLAAHHLAVVQMKSRANKAWGRH